MFKTILLETKAELDEFVTKNNCRVPKLPLSDLDIENIRKKTRENERKKAKAYNKVKYFLIPWKNLDKFNLYFKN